MTTWTNDGNILHFYSNDEMINRPNINLSPKQIGAVIMLFMVLSEATGAFE